MTAPPGTTAHGAAPERRQRRAAVDDDVRSILRRSHELDNGIFAVGIEILPYKLVGVIMERDGTPLQVCRRYLPDMQPSRVVEHIAQLARTLASSLGCALPSDRICLGVQLGGPVDPENGVVRYYANSPDEHGKDRPPYEWTDVPLAAGLRAATGCATAVENDAHAFAAYEQSLGVGRAADSFAVVLIRDGVGAGVVIDRERLAIPMEFGHLRVWARGRICDCGMRGCVESQAGNRALTAVVKERTGCELDGLEAAVALADSDDARAPAAGAAFHKAGVTIARGIATLLTTFGPRHVVIYAPERLIATGPGRVAAHRFLRAVETFPAGTFHTEAVCTLVTKPLDPVRGAHGAALVALQRCFRVRL
ncbi:ROK family protein [Streptomyces sp. URMC 123]|uniref:ROK family protein n=1 Tax=Streptomyces sp. URMC 123 TaxID=3423403 RepID=UPI003F1A6DF3